MATNMRSATKILETLRNENMTGEHTSVFENIRSDNGMVRMKQTMDEVQFTELCEILITLISKPYKDEMNDSMKKSEEAKITLYCLLENYGHYHINFFEMILHIDRKRRLKILETLNGIGIHTLARLMQDLVSINFIDDCLKTVRTSIEWNAINDCTDNIESFETPKSTDEKNYEEQLILDILSLLYRLYEYSAINSPVFNIEPIHTLLFQRVIPLAYMGDKRQRTQALKVLNQALNTNLISYIKDKQSNLWIQYKNTLRNIYCTKMSLLVKAAECDWSNQWCFSIRMLGTELHRGAELVNNLLNVEEKAFKSTDMTIRKEAFESWRDLIDNFTVSTTEFATLRRIKLLCIPLNAKNSKTEMIAVTKLKTWWHFIVKLYANSNKLLNQVIGQFLDFCFGPLGDTPLLSKRCNIVPSPGKRFVNTKLLAIDTLFQLLIQNPTDRLQIPSFIKERLPNAISNIVFQECYKSLFHSVGEVILVVHELNEGELSNCNQLNNILWSNLMIYIQQSSVEQKAYMYQELILIVDEIMNHVTHSSLVIDPLFNIIVVQLVKDTYLTYCDTTLMELLLKFLSPRILKSFNKDYLKDLLYLIAHVIKPKSYNVFHPFTLTIIRSTLAKMELLVEHGVRCFVFDLWYILAELMIKYMAENQQINEGTTMKHNFESIELLITFPIHNVIWYNTTQLIKIVKLWRELYKQFVVEANFTATVKPNEILHNITRIMRSSLSKNRKCYNFIAHCLDVLIDSVNYDEIVSKKKSPSLINLLCDMTVAAISEMNIFAIESSLKVTSSMLITVYGLNQTCALMYLDILKPCIEYMLQVQCAVSAERVIINAWEIVVLLLCGLTKLLTYEHIMSYQQIIILALSHKNYEIAAQALSLMDIKSILNKEAKILIEQFEEIAQKKMRNILNLEHKNKDSMHTQKVGSYSSEKKACSETMVSIKEESEVEEKKVLLLPLVPDPDSLNVDTENDVKFGINHSTEHQKEREKQYIDDTLSVYYDSSQSASHDVSQYEHFFDNNPIVNGQKNIDIAHENIIMNGEVNKDNSVSSCIDPIENNNGKWNGLTNEKKLNKDKSNLIIELNQVENEDELKNGEFMPSNLLSDGEIDLIEKTMNESVTESCIPHIVPKKLNFKFHEKFSNENTHADFIMQHSTLLEMVKIHRGREIVDNSSTKSHDDTEPQSLELLHTLRRGRSRSKSSKINEQFLRRTRFSNNSENQSKQNLKRKAASVCISERFSNNKRRQYTRMLHSSSETHSDTKSNNSIKDGNYSKTLPKEDLPKRTMKEMSRLQINMVFNSRMPSKLRSKSTDDYVYERNSRRQKSTKYSNEMSLQKTPRQESNNCKRKNTQSLHALLEPTQIQFAESSKTNPETEKGEIDSNDKEVLSDTSRSIAATEFNANLCRENKEKRHVCDNHYKSDQNDSAKNSLSVHSNYICGHDEEEVVENSQKANSLLRSPNWKNEEQHTVSSKQTIAHKVLGTTLLINQQIGNVPKSLYEESIKPIPASNNFTSPKSIKLLPKTKTFMPQCRAAHMLGMVTKLVIGEKNESSNNIKYSEENSTQFKLSKNLENDRLLLKKERTLIFKEPDRVGSPSGSRQEKIFKNMKFKDYVACSPTKLFSKLKNDGKKVSPKLEGIVSGKSTESSDTNHNTESSMLLKKCELSMLELSHANPLSLASSPSMSILKQQRQTVLDVDNDMMPSKRKRVSFADPPVSQAMDYEVINRSALITANEFDSHSSPGRNGISVEVKHTHFGTKQKVEKGNQLLKNQSNELSLTDMVGNILEQNNILAKNSDELKKNIETSEMINVIHNKSFSDDEANNIFNKNICAHDSLNTPPIGINNIEGSVNTQDIGKTTLKSHINHYDKLTVEKYEKLIVSEAQDSGNFSKCNITNDITIAELLYAPCHNEESNELEETLDVQNVSNLDFIENFDELPCDLIKLPRTSSSMNTIADCDTLPISDSVLFGQAMSEDNLPTQQSLVLSQPHIMDVNHPIYPKLLGCNDPIGAIVNNLVDSAWAKNLLKYFAARSINTIGDLAQLSEREVARFPIKGSPKMNCVKRILDKFSLSHFKSLGDEEAPEAVSMSSRAIWNALHVDKKHAEIFDDIPGLNAQNCKNKNNASAVISDIIMSDNQLSNANVTERDITITKESFKKTIKIFNPNVCSSPFLHTSIPPLLANWVIFNQVKKMRIPISTMMKTLTPLSSDNHSASSQIKLEELELNFEGFLQQIDPILLRQKAINVNSSENITQCKMKMQRGFETKNVTTEEKNSVNIALSKFHTLNAMLKRLPMDSIINHTIMNDELMTSSLLLEIALQYNNPNTVIRALETRFPNVFDSMIRENMSFSTLISYIDKSNLSEDKLFDIYRSVCDKFSPGQLLDAHNEVMKEKLSLLHTNKL